MEHADFEHFKDVLLERQQHLNEWLNLPAPQRGNDVAAVRQYLAKIKEALDQIECESYGCCVVCGGDVEHHALEVQPTRRVCLDCISDEERISLEDDLYVASTIHRALLPQKIPAVAGFDIGLRSLAAGSIGGDYYDFLTNSNSHEVRVVIGDAMGKGLPAGLLMSNLQGALRVLSSELESPAELLGKLNGWICRNVPVTKFISLVCVGLDGMTEADTRVTYANAGHCPPILIRKNGDIEQLEVTGGILGVHEGFTYGERSLTLHSGDSILLYTDGVVECENAEGSQYAESRLVEYLLDRRGDPADDVITSLVADVLNFAGSPQPPDDLTAVLLRKV